MPTAWRALGTSEVLATDAPISRRARRPFREAHGRRRLLHPRRRGAPAAKLTAEWRRFHLRSGRTFALDARVSPARRDFRGASGLAQVVAARALGRRWRRGGERLVGCGRTRRRLRRKALPRPPAPIATRHGRARLRLPTATSTSTDSTLTSTRRRWRAAPTPNRFQRKKGPARGGDPARAARGALRHGTGLLDRYATRHQRRAPARRSATSSATR
jgi:hypothetical protein